MSQRETARSSCRNPPDPPWRQGHACARCGLPALYRCRNRIPLSRTATACPMSPGLTTPMFLSSIHRSDGATARAFAINYHKSCRLKQTRALAVFPSRFAEHACCVMRQACAASLHTPWPFTSRPAECPHAHPASRAAKSSFRCTRSSSAPIRSRSARCSRCIRYFRWRCRSTAGKLSDRYGYRLPWCSARAVCRRACCLPFLVPGLAALYVSAGLIAPVLHLLRGFRAAPRGSREKAPPAPNYSLFSLGIGATALFGP